MKLALRPTSVCVATAALTAILSDARPSAAQAPRYPGYGPPPYGAPYASGSVGEIHTFSTTEPNGDLIATGVFTFGLPYTASIIVATQSNRSADNYLYAPVAGPWLDLANRGECPQSAACGNETAFRALLIANGVLQGVGVLQVLSGFLFPVTHSVTTVETAGVRVRVVPQMGRDGYGLTAMGTF
jgi:hypothetical protein